MCRGTESLPPVHSRKLSHWLIKVRLLTVILLSSYIHFFVGKLKEAKALLNDAIKRLESSASAQQEFCKVSINYYVSKLLLLTFCFDVFL